MFENSKEILYQKKKKQSKEIYIIFILKFLKGLNSQFYLGETKEVRSLSRILTSSIKWELSTGIEDFITLLMKKQQIGTQDWIASLSHSCLIQHVGFWSWKFLIKLLWFTSVGLSLTKIKIGGPNKPVQFG